MRVHLAAAVVSVVGLAAPVLAAPRIVEKSAVCRAVEFLVLGQRDFQSAPATWSWRAADEEPAANTAGLIAQAIAVAGARCTTGVAVTRFAGARAAELERWQMLYDGDVEALAAASVHEPRLLDAARLGFERRYSGASGRELVERWFIIRSAPELVAFDTAQAIRAALAVGDRDKATELAGAALSEWKRWAGDERGVYSLASSAALLEALLLLDATRYAGAPEVAKLRQALLERQGKDGSWGQGQTQATAYAVRALGLLPDVTSRAAAERGRAWLERTQKSDGSWSSDGEVIYEVVAEATLALYGSTR